MCMPLGMSGRCVSTFVCQLNIIACVLAAMDSMPSGSANMIIDWEMVCVELAQYELFVALGLGSADCYSH